MNDLQSATKSNNQHDLIAIFPNIELPFEDEEVLFKNLRGSIFGGRYIYAEYCGEFRFNETFMSWHLKPTEIICWYRISNNI